MASIGLFHTSPVHVPTFEARLHEHAPDVETVWVVDETALELATGEGPQDPDVVERVRAALLALAGKGASHLVCTCSTLGGLAEDLGAQLGLSVTRVDRAMVELAVDAGARIGVVAALEATVGPTSDLLAQVAQDRDRIIELQVEVDAGAWALFVAGDQAGYTTSILKTCETLANQVDVIVLAQASMAAVADHAELPIPIFASPEPAVAAVVHRLRSTRPT